MVKRIIIKGDFELSGDIPGLHLLSQRFKFAEIEIVNPPLIRLSQFEGSIKNDAPQPNQVLKPTNENQISSCENPKCTDHYSPQTLDRSGTRPQAKATCVSGVLDSHCASEDTVQNESEKQGCGLKIATLNGKDITCGDEMLGGKRYCNHCRLQDNDSQDNKSEPRKRKQGLCTWDVECGNDGYLCSFHKHLEDEECKLGIKNNDDSEDISPCPKCNCMTKSIRLGRATYQCGKCKADKSLSDVYYYEATHKEESVQDLKNEPTLDDEIKKEIDKDYESSDSL